MNLTFNVNDDGFITECISEDDIRLSFDGIIAFSMSFMESACKDFLKANKDEAESLYDSMDYLFYKFMERVFPDVQPREFDLSDAGLLYAQDMIINEAAKKGMTYDEALKHYEAKAKEYVKKNSRRLS